MGKSICLPGALVALHAVLAMMVCVSPAAADPVYYGGTEDYDACPIVGEVRGLNPRGDNFLAVRAGPGARHRMLDKLHSRQLVFVCEERGGWLGIVYGRTDCEVNLPILTRTAYRGPCRAGWVSRKYVAEVAG